MKAALRSFLLVASVGAVACFDLDLLHQGARANSIIGTTLAATALGMTVGVSIVIWLVGGPRS